MFYDRRKILLIRDFWFVHDREKENEKGVDYVQYHDVLSVILDKKGIVKETIGKTIVNDISGDLNEILKLFKKNTRYEIRRAEKDGCSAQLFWSDQLRANTALLEEFDREHKKMFQKKGHDYKSELPNMMGALKRNMLALSVVYLPDGNPCAYHVYIVGNKVARLLHSVSVFREMKTSAERASIGRANRYLHFMDIKALKEKGYATYDWGGYSESEDQISITEFKESFGGEIRDVYRYIFAVSLIARLATGFIRRRIKR